jgi:large subunit ribosomal protein L23
MNKERILTVLRRPHVSEKAAMSSNGYSQYVFEVAKDACKFEIKTAVEELFNVKVRNVRTCNVKGKRVRFGRMQGRQNDWKKAYITLERDQQIDIAGQAA